MGTVVKSGDDEDPIGVFTALNTTRYAEMQSLADTKQYLLEHCSEEGTRAKISAVRLRTCHRGFACVLLTAQTLSPTLLGTMCGGNIVRATQHAKCYTGVQSVWRSQLIKPN